MRSMVNFKLDTVADHIRYLGHDEDFAPKRDGEPTTAPPGSPERVEVYRLRVIRGEPVFHPEDVVDQEGIIGGAMKPNGGRVAPTKVSIAFVQHCRVVRKTI